MGAGKSMNFEPAVLDKYATAHYYLSRGSSGNVYGPIRLQRSKLAIKQVMLADGKVTDEFKNAIKAKKDIWTSLNHKNLIRIHWVDLTRLPKVMFIVMDYAAGGSLYKTLRSLGSENKLPIDVVTDWAKQIADGMLYLHEKNIVHRDLKSSNILLMKPFDASNLQTILTLKIADFDEIKEHDQTATMSTFVGTCAYMAPEVLKDQWFSKASDVWSCGVVIWEMLSGEIPHKGLELSALISRSIDGKLSNLTLEESFPLDYKLLLKRCWESTYMERISIHGLSNILQQIGDGSRVYCFRKESLQDIDSKFCIKNADKFTSFDPSVLDKYTTANYCMSRKASSMMYGPIPWQGSILAIKQALFSNVKFTDELIKDIAAKKDIWTSLEHKNLIKIQWVDLTRLPKVMFIVMDYAAGGSLYKTLRSLGSENKLPIDVVTDWAKQIADGMLYLHEKNIVHRDLKSANILLLEPFDVRNPQTIIILKVADFDEIKKHDHETKMSFVETCADMAPEVRTHARFSKASDVWSFGVVIWEMLSGDIMHKGLEQTSIMHNSISRKMDKLPLEPSFTGDYRLLLSRCWESIYMERISFHDISVILQRIGRPVCGLAILNREVLISRLSCSDIEVYDSTTFDFKRRMAVDRMTNSENIVSCSINNCLYASGTGCFNKIPAILRIDPLNGNLVTSWNLYGKGGLLSIASDTHVILINDEALLYEYTADGKLVYKINLSILGTYFLDKLHAAKLPNGLFVVSHYKSRDPQIKVYLFSFKERTSAADTFDEVEILETFAAEQRESISAWRRTLYLSVSTEGLVLFSDEYSNEAILLSSNLRKLQVLVSEEHGVDSPRRTCFDESTGQWLVADSRCVMVCRVEDKAVERMRYDLVGH